MIYLKPLFETLSIDEVYQDFDEEDEDNYREFSDGKTTVAMRYDSDIAKWVESDIIKGKTPDNYGSKRYQSYLSGDDIATWLSKDYGGRWKMTSSTKRSGKTRNKKRG